VARTVGHVASFMKWSQCSAQLVESFDYICSIFHKGVLDPLNLLSEELTPCLAADITSYRGTTIRILAA
jgi:hypothetical protein